MTQRRDVEFRTEDGLTLRGWLYVPEAGVKVPAVVLANGFAGVKEMYLDRYAEAFASRGLAALVYDHRTLGASDGEPRCDVDPWKEIDDHRAAISFVQGVPEIDADRIGVWGTSYGGSHVLVLGAIDRRISCVVSQAAVTNMQENIRRWLTPDGLTELRGELAEDRERRLRGEASARMAIVSATPDTGPCLNPSREAYDFLAGAAGDMAPNWRNECTLRAVEKLIEYEPRPYIRWISPTPLLMVVASDDVAAVTDITLASYTEAREPKELRVVNCRHFELYVQHFDESSSVAAEFLVKHLRAVSV